MVKVCWGLLAITSLAGGIAGIILPILPGIPFLILALICVGKISQHFRHWLLHTRAFQWLNHHEPQIARWIFRN
ncbi:DUF454 family protein [Paucilactobacillus vaccinostercus]|uniref:DUF454 family protein n=1 Tax=Paucilactobacillus vaccinostercus TaxID=176291 RepID=UPI002286E53F|nr:DUF454 family protein [Paucilactobacillus vaccinostercus]